MIKYLMHKDDVVAIFDCNDFYIKEITVIRDDLMPFIVSESPKKFNEDFQNWRQNRCIPDISQKFQNTKNFTVGLNYIDISNSVQASVTDCYWFKIKSLFNVKWEEINYYINKLSDRSGGVMLDDDKFEKFYDQTEVLKSYFENNPRMPKNIKYFALDQTDNYCIVKADNIENKGYDIFNEIIGNIICDAIDLPHAEYYVVPYKIHNRINSVEVPLIACELCVQNDNLEVITMKDLIRSGKINESEVYGDMVARGYQTFLDKMITLDFLMMNSKRDFSNFGYIRDANNLRIIGVMPIFDCGSSLGYDEKTKRNGDIIKDYSMPFKEKHTEQIKLVSSFEWLNINDLYECIDEIEAVLSYSALPNEKQKEILNIFVSRIHLLEQYISNTGMETVITEGASNLRIIENIKHRFNVEKIKECEGFDPTKEFKIDKIFFGYLSDEGKKEFESFDAFNPNMRERFIKFKEDTFQIKNAT